MVTVASSIEKKHTSKIVNLLSPESRRVQAGAGCVTTAGQGPQVRGRAHLRLPVELRPRQGDLGPGHGRHTEHSVLPRLRGGRQRRQRTVGHGRHPDRTRSHQGSKQSE